MSLAESQSPGLHLVETGRKGSKVLHVFLVTIQSLQGSDTETYWIDAPNRMAAKYRAARYAGVSSEQVVEARPFHYLEKR